MGALAAFVGVELAMLIVRQQWLAPWYLYAGAIPLGAVMAVCGGFRGTGRHRA
jgi:hypothetical protein